MIRSRFKPCAAARYARIGARFSSSYGGDAQLSKTGDENAIIVSPLDVVQLFATALHERSVGIKTIQHLMGHQSIQTTAIYVTITDDQMTKAVNAI